MRDAERLLRKFAEQAYRRPVSEKEKKRFLPLVERALEKGSSSAVLILAEARNADTPVRTPKLNTGLTAKKQPRKRAVRLQKALLKRVNSLPPRKLSWSDPDAGQEVGMIGGQAITEDLNWKFAQTFPDHLAVSVSIFAKTKQEGSIVTTMGQMITLAGKEVSISPWHGCKSAKQHPDLTAKKQPRKRAVRP